MFVFGNILVSVLCLVRKVYYSWHYFTNCMGCENCPVKRVSKTKMASDLGIGSQSWERKDKKCCDIKIQIKEKYLQLLKDKLFIVCFFVKFHLLSVFFDNYFAFGKRLIISKYNLIFAPDKGTSMWQIGYHIRVRYNIIFCPSFAHDIVHTVYTERTYVHVSEYLSRTSTCVCVIRVCHEIFAETFVWL